MTRDAPDQAVSTVLMIVAAGRHLSRQLDAELAELGLTLRHLGALGHLMRRPDLSYSDLARRAGITTQSMHATVRALEDSGAVRRTLPGQGHAARLEITDHGRELLAAARRATAALDDRLLAGLDTAQRAALRDALLALAPSTRPGGEPSGGSPT